MAVVHNFLEYTEKTNEQYIFNGQILDMYHNKATKKGKYSFKRVCYIKCISWEFCIQDYRIQKVKFDAQLIVKVRENQLKTQMQSSATWCHSMPWFPVEIRVDEVRLETGFLGHLLHQ